MNFESILKQKKVYVIMLVLALWVGCIPSPSFALPVGSYEQGGGCIKDREIIDTFLAQGLVSERLAEMGLSKTEIEARLDKLSEAQIHTLAMRLERIKSGGSGAAVAIAIVILLVAMVLFFLTHDVHVEPKQSLEK